MQAFSKKRRLKSMIKLNRKILMESMMLERIMMEFKQNKRWIEYIMSAISSLKMLNSTIPDNLQVVMMQRIERQTTSLDEHLNSIKKFNDDFLANANTDVMYRLAKRSFWVSVVGTVFTIIAALIAAIEIYKEWENVKKIWLAIKNWF